MAGPTIVLWREDIEELDRRGSTDLIQLAEQMQDHCPDSHILQRIAEVESQTLASPVSWQTGHDTVSGIHPAPMSVAPASPTKINASPAAERVQRIYSGMGSEVVPEIGKTLSGWINREPERLEAHQNSLQRATRRPDWTEARALAATLIRREGGPLLSNGHLSLQSLVYAIATAYETPTSDLRERSELLQAACLASVLFSANTFMQYFYRETIESFPAQSLVTIVVGGDLIGPESVQDALAPCLADLLNRSIADPVYQSVYQLFWRASLIVDAKENPCSAHMASLLWETLKNLRSNQPRPELVPTFC